MDAREEQGTRRPRRPGWTRSDFWQAPIGPIYVATLVQAVGRGAWYTCWALFYLRSVGLSPAEFGIGVTAAGVVGMLAGMPFGYLADRVGPREVLIVLSVVQGLATIALAFISGFWAVMLVTCAVVMAERAGPGIRIAVVSGLTSGPGRLKAISNCHIMKETGAVAGSLVGGFVLFFDSRPAYVALVAFCGAAHLVFALLVSRVPHVESLRERKIRRKVLVLRDRPFLVFTVLSGVLALNWGMLDAGLPVWLTTHTQAPPWTMGALMAFNGVVIVLLLNRFTQAASTVPRAGRLGILAGVTLGASCVVFATTDGGTGTVVIVLLFVAAAVQVVGELFFVSSTYGLAVGMTKEDAHGEYQGMFTSGTGAAMMLAPGLLTALLSGWGVAGWLLLGALFVAAGVGLPLAGRWSMREQRKEEATGPHTEMKTAA
ncbi:MFS transporter [Amycolatopsis sp. lyj-112]|uniref:MFS transporter n=1 Tax=Amycolatopsis sp. lyj-112 TaxID=2789288 RepID=UPI00397A8AD6